MEEKREPDIVIDACPSCGGLFLDKSELNILVTGRSGDIEFCLCPSDEEDSRPSRACPKCDSQTMSKTALLSLPDIIFDCCPNCEGLFLDKNEIEAMNAELREQPGRKWGEDLREYRDGRLVLIDRFIVARLEGGVSVKTGTSIRAVVYFKKPLNLELRIVKERWIAKLGKVIGLFTGQDISTGNHELDKSFIIQGNDEERIRGLLALDEVRQSLLDLSSKAPPIVRKSGTLEVLDFCLSYTEGPYTGHITTDLSNASSKLIDRMTHLAALLDSPGS
jgi:Zn-finger nucleic acid-binding protein